MYLPSNYDRECLDNSRYQYSTSKLVHFVRFVRFNALILCNAIIAISTIIVIIAIIALIVPLLPPSPSLPPLLRLHVGIVYQLLITITII